MLFIKNLKLRLSSKKLFDKYIEFFIVIELVKTQTYRLQFSSKYNRLHSIFHVSLLKMYKKKHDKYSKDFLLELDDFEQKYKVETILNWVKKENEILYLVKFIEYSNEKNEWLFLKNLIEADKLRRKFNRKFKIRKKKFI